MLQNESQLGQKVGVRSHLMDVIMLDCAGNIDVPEGLAGQLLHGSVVLFCFQTNGQIIHVALLFGFTRF